MVRSPVVLCCQVVASEHSKISGGHPQVLQAVAHIGLHGGTYEPSCSEATQRLQARAIVLIWCTCFNEVSLAFAEHTKQYQHHTAPAVTFLY
jgi:hypothetical protein